MRNALGGLFFLAARLSFRLCESTSGVKMQTLLVDLILAAAVGVVFLIARQSKNWGYMPRLSQRGGISAGESALAKFFVLFWGWADYNPKDWSSASYKRGYGDERRRSTIKYR